MKDKQILMRVTDEDIKNIKEFSDVFKDSRAAGMRAIVREWCALKKLLKDAGREYTSPGTAIQEYIKNENKES